VGLTGAQRVARQTPFAGLHRTVERGWTPAEACAASTCGWTVRKIPCGEWDRHVDRSADKLRLRRTVKKPTSPNVFLFGDLDAAPTAVEKTDIDARTGRDHVPASRMTRRQSARWPAAQPFRGGESRGLNGERDERIPREANPPRRGVAWVANLRPTRARPAGCPRARSEVAMERRRQGIHSPGRCLGRSAVVPGSTHRFRSNLLAGRRGPIRPALASVSSAALPPRP
jgi:hypothetical protein